MFVHFSDGVFWSVQQADVVLRFVWPTLRPNVEPRRFRRSVALLVLNLVNIICRFTIHILLGSFCSRRKIAFFAAPLLCASFPVEVMFRDSEARDRVVRSMGDFRSGNHLNLRRQTSYDHVPHSYLCPAVTRRGSSSMSGFHILLRFQIPHIINLIIPRNTAEWPEQLRPTFRSVDKNQRLGEHGTESTTKWPSSFLTQFKALATRNVLQTMKNNVGLLQTAKVRQIFPCTLRTRGTRGSTIPVWSEDRVLTPQKGSCEITQ